MTYRSGRRPVRASLWSALAKGRVLPPVLLIGLSLLVVGGAIDLVAHTVPASWIGLSPGVVAALGEAGHVVSFAGMALSVAGLVLIGLAPDRGEQLRRRQRGKVPPASASNDVERR
ncbi:hypothetical protein NET02_01240 [Thermomicrobiaceae bacterium CFH 74404]|uniref:Uncharacterized protein n=1 Tax=Thermalbibacter longus TaxID=2951981 RepID=A0AA42B918_9BACT|nr:hypothetical protein [Thermalbibacter longus]MCM8747766.1 hypothetical protein [Thermalbibacter longus]